MKKDVKVEVPDAPTVKKVAEWATLGQQFGAGLAQTAKELGIAANDFVNTPVGKLVAAIIVWKLVGGAAVHIIAGVAFFIVATPIWMYNWRRLCLIKSVKHTGGSHFFGFISNKEYEYYKSGDVDGERFAMSLVAAAIIAVTVLIIFTY